MYTIESDAQLKIYNSKISIQLIVKNEVLVIQKNYKDGYKIFFANLPSEVSTRYLCQKKKCQPDTTTLLALKMRTIELAENFETLQYFYCRENFSITHIIKHKIFVMELLLW